MKGFAKALLAVAASMLLAVSCSKEENTGAIGFTRSAILFDNTSEKATVGFWLDNVSGYAITGGPTGWDDPVIDPVAQTITVTSPASFDGDGVERSGKFILSGVVNGGNAVSASLFVAVVASKDLSDKPANSYVVNQKDTRYTFDALHKGDGTSSLATAYVELIWQSMTSLVQYVQFDKGKASFFIEADKDGKLREGNALIGAFDASGTLIWSWHIWSSDYDPDKEVLSYTNGFEVMTRNLGALDNSNQTDAQKLASLGLYYQWGRKDPFINPSSYQSHNGLSATMYNASNTRVELKMAASDETVGTMAYAVQNPMTFITGVEDSNFDWLRSAHSDALWGDRKTVNDPCPYGWKVAPAGAFSGLTIKELDDNSYAGYENKYGWMLTDGSVTSLYMGAGRRVYTNGKFQNVYNPLPPAPASRNVATEAQPWVGYYWTTATLPEAQSAAMFFWYNKIDPSASGIAPQTSVHRANGMSVRCVRDK